MDLPDLMEACILAGISGKKVAQSVSEIDGEVADGYLKGNLKSVNYQMLSK